MTLEKLKQLLESGAITQAEYDVLAAKLNDDGSGEGDGVKGGAASTEGTNNDGSDSSLDMSNIDRLIQAKVDKATAKLGKEKAELQKKLETLRNEKLTEGELKQLEIEEKERAIAEREKEISERENRLYAVKAIKEAGLDDGSDLSLAIVDFVLADDTATIDARVKAFKDLFTKTVQAEVDKRFKENGRTPNKGGAANGGVNPFKKETFNLTEQMKLEISNPELAAQLRAEAGA